MFSLQSEEGDQLSSLMQRVSESTYRLRTFETVFPASDIQHWLAFSHTDMLEEFIVHLRMVSRYIFAITLYITT